MQLYGRRTGVDKMCIRDRGKMADMVYTIYEQPQHRPEAAEEEQPGLENPVSGNPTQLNKDIQTKDPLTTEPSSTHSIPILILNEIKFGSDNNAI